LDKPKPPRPALMVHAGAWDIPAEEREPHARACRAALDAGWAVLAADGSALDAVETAIATLEDDPAVNAGTGSVLTRDGEVELDAGLMCGLTLDAGAVIGQRTVKNPIRLARAILGSDYVLLSGRSAEEVVRAKHLVTCAPGAFITDRERARLEAWRARGGAANPGGDFGARPRAREGPGDTVGAVAVDGIGRIAAGLSTGGMCGKPSGRIGDAPIPNCGYFADNRLAGVACTGWGEGILRMGLARRTAELARDNGAQDAAWLAIRELQDRIDGKAGVIVISRNGSIGWAFNTPFMALGYRDTETDFPVIKGLGNSA
jgi:beta-aspartyl-peptidase (threonine type)